jgi:hypothetical protein
MHIGIDTVSITPSASVELAGFGYFLNRVSTGAEGDLTATAVTFEDSDGRQAALCAVDLISIDEATVAKVQSAVTKKSNGEFADATLLVNASHTHSGPATHNLLGAGGYNLEYIDNVLVPRLAHVVVHSFRTASEGVIGVARTETEGLNYNRTGGLSLDTRVTAIRVDSDFQ